GAGGLEHRIPAGQGFREHADERNSFRHSAGLRGWLAGAARPVWPEENEGRTRSGDLAGGGRLSGHGNYFRLLGRWRKENEPEPERVAHVLTERPSAANRRDFSQP